MNPLELKGCPWCGCLDARMVWALCDGRKYSWVKCGSSRCGAAGPRHKTAGGAIKAWNAPADFARGQ